MAKVKIAVIIKHPYRDFDYRIDMVEVDEDTPYDDIKAVIEYEMLGPFQVLAFSTKISDRDISKQLADLNERRNKIV